MSLFVKMHAAHAPMRIVRRIASDTGRERVAEEFWESALDAPSSSHAEAAEQLALQLYAEMHPTQEKGALTPLDELENHGGEEFMHPSSASKASQDSEPLALPPKRSNAVARSSRNSSCGSTCSPATEGEANTTQCPAF